LKQLLGLVALERVDVDTRAPGQEVLHEGMDQANIPTLFLGIGIFVERQAVTIE
jgi:hypothetical protein